MPNTIRQFPNGDMSRKNRAQTLAAQNKEGKESRDKKGKDEVAGALRRLAEELATLRTEVQGLKAASAPTDAPVTPVPASSEAGGDWGAIFDALNAARKSEEPLRPAADATVARLGYAFASAPKVTLVRLLLEGGEQPAARLGDGANLSTGSLYHHLRELIHAEVVVQETRNRYALTPQGRRAALTLFALVG